MTRTRSMGRALLLTRRTTEVARTTRRLADAMSVFVVQETESGAPLEMAAFRERFGDRLARTCRDLKRHGALSAEEEKLIGLALDTPHLGVRALPVFLTDKARQLGWPH